MVMPSQFPMIFQKEMKKHVPHEGGTLVHPISADLLKPVVDDFKARVNLSKWAQFFCIPIFNFTY